MSTPFGRAREEVNTYQMTIAGLQGLVDGLADLAGGRLPGAESQLAMGVLIS